MSINLELVLGVIMIAIGLISMGMMISAKSKIGEAGDLKIIIERCTYVVIFLTCYSVWHVLREAFHWKKIYGDIVEYPEYLFISLAYFMILWTANTLKNIAVIFKKL